MSDKSRLDEIRDELEKLDINPTIFARKEIRELPQYPFGRRKNRVFGGR